MVLGDISVENDDRMFVDLLNPLGGAITRDIGAGGINRPRYVGELAAEQFLIVRSDGANGNVGFPAVQIERFRAPDQFDGRPG